MDGADLPLFRRFPGLAARLPRRAYLKGPTPVEALALPGAPPGTLFVKRDDRSTDVYGGNKPRKLELLIGHALARGSRRLVTSGGLGTNHGLATTLLGREAGLATTLLLVDQPVTADVREKLLLDHAFGARLRYGGNVLGAVREGVAELARSTLAGERPTLVPVGGTSPRGTLGFVSAGLELAEQVAAGALPAPRRVYVPVGSGGTLAGLVAGLRLAGLPSRVVGVLVTDLLAPSPARLARLARRTLRFLRRLAPEAPEPAIGPGDFDFVTDQVGPGYGAATPAACDAVAAAGACGLVLDTTYSGKAFAALQAALAHGDAEAPVLFWLTYSSVDVAALAPFRPAPADLPAPFHRFFEGDA